ncbi:MAG TPA: hypothetical protein VMN39_02310, partial [Longimicrobiaceae bacterium]|nr:hypothetical protein [Longimicrobiaceae bacterium]
IQMVRIRITPETGDPDREQLPDDNQVRPGGTEGEKRTQSEESASRQEPFLWVGPETFAEAVLSTWDGRDLKPATATRVPPLLRFNQRLRQLFLQDLRPEGVYDNRLLAAMDVFTAGGWLDYREVRDALGGGWVNVKARDTGRFSAAYSGNPPINDEAQIRIPNFFTSNGVTLPVDLFGSVQEHYSRTILGIFELASEAQVPAARSLAELPVDDAEDAAAGRRNVLRALEVIQQQALPEQ